MQIIYRKRANTIILSYQVQLVQLAYVDYVEKYTLPSSIENASTYKLILYGYPKN